MDSLNYNSVIPDFIQPQFDSEFKGDNLGILDITNSGNTLATPTYDPVAAGLDRFANTKASSTALSSPTTFDYDRTQADRYVNSKYYGQLGFDPNINNEYKYGSVQTWGDAMGNALGGAWKLAGSTFIEGWKGWGKMADALTSWDSSKLVGTPDELYQQNKEQTAVMNKYAIFSTPESDAGGLMNKKFFGDMVQQSGFAVGTIAQFLTEELLTYGLSTEFSISKLGLKAPAWMGKVVTKADVAADMVRLGETAWKDKTIAEKVVAGARKFVPLAETANDISRYSKAGAGAMQIAAIGVGGLRRSIAEANMAFTEARMEAAGTYGELYNKLYDEHVYRTGNAPDAVSQQRMKELSLKAANDNFFVNSGILMLTNRLQFDNIFSKFSLGREVLGEGGGFADDVLKVTGKSAGKDATKVYEKGFFRTPGLYGKISQDFGRKTAAWEVAKSAGKNLMKWETTEGLQEVFQDLSNQSLQNYYYDMYHGVKGADFSPSIAKAWEQEKQNNQGLKTFLMGALTGALISPINFGVGAAKRYGMTTSEQRADRQKDIKESVDLLNGFYENPNKYLNEQIANVKVQNRVAKGMDEAIANRDRYQFNNYKDSAFAKMVSASIKTDMFESVMSTLKGYGESFDDTDFKEAFGIDKTKSNVDSVKEFFGKVAAETEGIQKNWKNLKDRYSDLVMPEIYKKGTPERKVAEVAKRALDDAIEILATNSFKAKRATDRATEIQSKMAAIPIVGSSIENAFRIMSHVPTMAGEIGLLGKEIEGLEANEQKDDASKKLLKDKKQQFKLLNDYLDQYLTLQEEDKNPYAVFAKGNFNKIFSEYINARNQQSNLDVTMKEDDVNDIFQNFMDYTQLNHDSKEYIDAYNIVANPMSFINMHDRMMDAILNTREKFKTEHEAEIKGEETPSDSGLADLMEKGITVDEANPENPEGEVVEKKSTDIENMLSELQDIYISYAKDLMENGQNIASPAQFLRFSAAAKKVLDKYGVSKDDIFSTVQTVTEENIDQVAFMYGKPVEGIVPEEAKSADTTEETLPQDNAQDTTDIPNDVLNDLDKPTNEPKGPSISVTIGNQTLYVGDRIVDNADVDYKIQSIDKDGNVEIETQNAVVKLTKDQVGQLLNNGYSKIIRNADKGKLAATEINRRDTTKQPKKTVLENGQIPFVNQNRAGMLDQANRDGIDSQVSKKEEEIVDKNKKVINGSTKINNRTEDFIALTDEEGKTSRSITGVNKSYPMVMATDKVNTGQPITLRVDENMTSYDEYDYINSNNVTKRSKSDYFDKNGKVKADMVDDFPIAIYTTVDGKEIKLGYLPTLKWVEAKYPNGSTVNVVDYISNKDGDVIDNLTPNVNALKKIRQNILQGFNQSGTKEHAAVVTLKSDGVIRTQSGTNKIANVFSPSTQLGIIKNGVVYLGKNQELALPESMVILPGEVSDVLNNKRIEGWPVALIKTPTGKTLATWVGIPTLKADHQDFILQAWKSFHELLNMNTAGTKYRVDEFKYQIANSIYQTYGSKLELDEKPDFKILQNYMNDYITFTSPQKYDPLNSGSSQITVLPDGTLIAYAVEEGDEKKDKVIMKSPANLTQENQDKYYNKAALVHYNVKFSDTKNNGINSDKKMSFLSVIGNTLVKSTPMTYNEYISNILETNIEPGIPVDEKKPDGEKVYFSNPVLNFEFTEPVEEIKTKEAAKETKPTESSQGLADMLLNAEFEQGLTDFSSFDKNLVDEIKGDKKSIATKISDSVEDNQIDKNCN